MDKVQLLKEFADAIKYDKVKLYKPYGHPDTLYPDGKLFKRKEQNGQWVKWSNKPWQLDFHAAGKIKRERMLMAANRPGKTYSAAAEVSYHMTGEYPDWWTGKRFDHPVLVWTGSPTNETSRDIVQKELLGGSGEALGSGSIPKRLIVGKPKNKQAGISDVVDVFKARHYTNGVYDGDSTCILKTYEQGWRKWQGTAPHVVWLDEEPEDSSVQGKIYTEALTRLLTSDGIMMVTFTPLLGVTTLVEHFQQGGDPIFLETATWDDAPHLNEKAKKELTESYPEHERDARTKGVPMMGEGRVFLTPEEDIKVDLDLLFPDGIPDHFARIKGIDFGIDHPAAVVEIAWDRDKDIVYVIKAKKKSDWDSEEHSQEINSDNPWVPVSWPHDGTTREKSNGIRLKDNYVKHGVRLLSHSARYKNDKGGAQPVEPIVMETQERLRTGGLKVDRSCVQFFDEYRNYHRKEGVLSKRRDDIIKAFFYALMMRRYASTKSFRPQKVPNHRPIVSV